MHRPLQPLNTLLHDQASETGKIHVENKQECCLYSYSNNFDGGFGALSMLKSYDTFSALKFDGSLRPGISHLQLDQGLEEDAG